jgi:hypothetical protein
MSRQKLFYEMRIIKVLDSIPQLTDLKKAPLSSITIEEKSI